MGGAVSLSARVKAYIPALSVLVLLWISATPSLFGSTVTSPNMLLAGGFFFLLYAPTTLPSWRMFLLGLAQDALSGTPLGLWALIAVMLWAILARVGRNLVHQPWHVQWVAAIVISAALLAIASLCMALLAKQPVALMPQLHAIAMLALWYPLLYLMLSYVLKILPAMPQR